MRKKMDIVIRVICAAVLIANCLPAFAQSGGTMRRSATATQDGATAAQAAEVTAWKIAGGDTFEFVAAEGAFGGKTVKGMPYSAQAVTEDVRVLSDGNRIVRRNTSSVYRDSEGRTRQEHTLHAIGPYAAAGDPPQMVSIFDPVEGTHYSLDSRNKTARKMSILRLDTSAKVDGADGVRVYRVPSGEVTAAATEEEKKNLVRRAHEKAQGQQAHSKNEVQERELRQKLEIAAVAGQGHGETIVVSPSVAVGRVGTYTLSDSSENMKKESLGTQNIEGVAAEGTRTTFTIPAGDIGNELPINIVTETWYSPELQVVVMRKHTDPQRGETTYRLTNINRSEPSRSLFEVPADYTLKESHVPARKLMIEQELNRAKSKAKGNGQEM